jgi:hypothetical protein
VWEPLAQFGEMSGFDSVVSTGDAAVSQKHRFSLVAWMFCIETVSYRESRLSTKESKWKTKT